MYYFVSENIFAYNSGTEHAQAQRVKFFNRQATQGRLGQASYVTRDYNRFLSRDANAIGLNADEVLNMYDYFQGTTNVLRQEQPLRLLSQIPVDKYHIVGHGPNYSTLEYAGRVVAKINVMPATVGLVNDITYYDRADNVTARENFDWRGFKSSVDYFHPDGRLAVQKFLNLSGETVLEVTHMNINGQLLPSMYKLINYLGHDYRFNTEEQLFLFFLNEITRQHPDTTLISDRRGLDHIVAGVQGTTRKFAYLHDIHTGDTKHPVRGKLYPAYINVLGALWGSIYSNLGANVGTTKRFTDTLSTLDHQSGTDVVIDDQTLAQPRVTLSERQLHQLLYVGRLSPEKRPEQALRVLARVVKDVPDATLVYYGYAATQEMMHDLQELATKLQVADHVTFGGYVPSTDLQKAYQQAQVILQTSVGEGLGMNLVEAMGNGVPSVSFDVPYGAHALIEDGVNGYVVPDGSNLVMAQKVSELLLDDDQWTQMSVAAYDKEQAFAESKMATIWQQVLN